MQLVDELATGVDAIESLMGDWKWVDLEDSADSLNRLEHEVEVLGRLGKSLEDGHLLNDATASAATARRAMEAAYRLVQDVSESPILEDRSVLADIVGRDEICDSTDISMVQEFLEAVIDEVLDDALDRLLLAVDFETAIATVEQNPEVLEDPDVVNAEGQIHMSNQSGTSHRYIPVDALKDFAARGWCKKFAIDAANSVKGMISSLDDQEESAEWLGESDRSVFTNDVLHRVVSTFLCQGGEMHIDDIVSALEAAQMSVDEARFDLDDPEVEVEAVVDALEEVCMELLRTARTATAHRTAFLALEQELEKLTEG